MIEDNDPVIDVEGTSTPRPTRTLIGFIPVADRLVVEQFSAEEVTEAGIIIPDQSQEKPNVGHVVAVGDGKLIETGGYRIPCPFVVGHVVMFGKYSGYKFSKDINGEKNKREFFALREDEVIGIIIDYYPALPTPKPAGMEGEK